MLWITCTSELIHYPPDLKTYRSSRTHMNWIAVTTVHQSKIFPQLPKEALEVEVPIVTG